MAHRILEISQAIRLSGDLTRRDKAGADYRLVPFTVPDDTERLRVDFSYAGLAPASNQGPRDNVLDIGLFDPRGGDFLAGEGFRGWSGSERSTFQVGEFDATPGYLPGPIYAGEWAILLGLCKIAPGGCHYEISVALDLCAERSSIANDLLPPPELQRSNERRWYPGDFHTHTHHSDGRGSVADLVADARDRGLRFVAVTEHNTSSHLPHLARLQNSDLLLIAGQEITTYYGHANAWGTGIWHDFRCRTSGEMAQVADRVTAAGGVFSVNHPKPGGPAWEFDLMDQADCLEVWHGPWQSHNEISLALWERELCQGHRLVAVGGSDCHQGVREGAARKRRLGYPTSWVCTDALTQEAVLDGIRSGHVMITQGPLGPKLYLEADADGDGEFEAIAGDQLRAKPGTSIRWRCCAKGGQGCHLRLVSPVGEQLLAVNEDEMTFEWQSEVAESMYVRAELLQLDDQADLVKSSRVALTNPIYVRPELGPEGRETCGQAPSWSAAG